MGDRRVQSWALALSCVTSWAASAGAQSAPAGEVVAVMPTRAAPLGERADEVSSLLTGALAARMGPVGGFRVVST